jgi:hypothetical protein
LKPPKFLTLKPPEPLVDELARRLKNLRKVNSRRHRDCLGVERNLDASQHRIGQHQTRPFFLNSLVFPTPSGAAFSELCNFRGPQPKSVVAAR